MVQYFLSYLTGIMIWFIIKVILPIFYRVEVNSFIYPLITILMASAILGWLKPDVSIKKLIIFEILIFLTEPILDLLFLPLPLITWGIGAGALGKFLTYFIEYFIIRYNPLIFFSVGIIGFLIGRKINK